MNTENKSINAIESNITHPHTHLTLPMEEYMKTWEDIAKPSAAYCEQNMKATTNENSPSSSQLGLLAELTVARTLHEKHKDDPTVIVEAWGKDQRTYEAMIQKYTAQKELLEHQGKDTKEVVKRINQYKRMLRAANKYGDIEVTGLMNDNPISEVHEVKNQLKDFQVIDYHINKYVKKATKEGKDLYMDGVTFVSTRDKEERGDESDPHMHFHTSYKVDLRKFKQAQATGYLDYYMQEGMTHGKTTIVDRKEKERYDSSPEGSMLRHYGTPYHTGVTIKTPDLAQLHTITPTQSFTYNVDEFEELFPTKHPKK